MKKLFVAASLLLFLNLPSFALPEDVEILLDAPLTFTTTAYALNLNNKSIWGVSAEVIYSSYVGTAVTFTQDNVDPNTESITIANTFPLAMPVLITLVSGTIPSGLTDKTTYYTSGNTSKVYLSSSSRDAGLGIYVNISTAPTGSSTLTPTALSGTPVFKLQRSNDGINYFDLNFSSGGAVPSISFASTYDPSASMWDLGFIFFKYLRLNYTQGTLGATNLKVLLNCKSFQ